MHGIYELKIQRPDGTALVYEGRSRSLKHRHSEHLTALRKGTHANSHLQRAYNKYGEAALSWRVIWSSETPVGDDTLIGWERIAIWAAKFQLGIEAELRDAGWVVEPHDVANIGGATDGGREAPMNGRGHRDAKSPYKGVHRDRTVASERCWRARLYVKGKEHHGGYHATEEQAARAYNRLADQVLGVGVGYRNTAPPGREVVV